MAGDAPLLWDGFAMKIEELLLFNDNNRRVFLMIDVGHLFLLLLC